MLIAIALPLWAAEKPRLRVEDYVIDAQIDPRAHRLAATARVKFTALDDITVATFELHNGLRPSRVTDASGQSLSAERVTQDNTVRVSLPQMLPKGQSSTLTFTYEGVLNSVDDSPVQGLKLASIGEDTSYLLYAGRWFPMVGYGLNRFTATISITVPAYMTVIGSGAESSGTPAPAASTPPAKGAKEKNKPAPPANSKTYVFIWSKPSFPGTIIAGSFTDYPSTQGGVNLHVYFKPNHKEEAAAYADTAAKEFQYFSAAYGAPLSTTLKVVELPDDTVPSASAPEIAALASRAISQKVNYRLLANAISRQWWGASLSPATMEDWWLTDGFARFSEARYVENAAGETAYQEVSKDTAVGALAYDTVPLSGVGRLDPFSPEFQSLVSDKGAMILSMLRWVINNEERFENTLRAYAVKFKGKPVSVDDFRTEAEAHYNGQLTWFFTQWMDSTGAPEFKNKYTVYRMGNGKGFRIIGEISQDLDLFRMPVELKIDTDGKTETKRIEVVGTNSAYQVETFGKPRRIAIDPGNQVLKNSSDIKVRASILRGQGLVLQGDYAEALREFQKALDSNRNSSLAHYRIAEVFFLQKNYQSAANAYREALNGDGDPRWTEVWSHIQLGKIFDISGQRERAINEYRQALQTNDSTQGALDEARKYLQSPYARTKPKEG